MQTVTNYKLQEEPEEEQREAKRFNPGSDILVNPRNRKFRMKVSAGNSDDVEVFREGEIYYVLSTNSRLGYFGLQAFRLDEDAYRDEAGNRWEPLTDKNKLYRKIGVPVETCDSIFCQGDETKIVPDWENISSMYLVKCLLEYLS